MKHSSRCWDLLRFIRDYMRSGWGPPTLREMRDALDLSSTNAPHELLVRLQKEGLVEKRESLYSRGWRPTREGHKAIEEHDRLRAVP